MRYQSALTGMRIPRVMTMSDGPQLKERDPISDGAFRELLKLYKQTNVWPVDDAKNRLMIVQFLDAEASKRGYEHWEQAYDDLIAGDADE